jgi:hypothetical protein
MVRPGGPSTTSELDPRTNADKKKLTRSRKGTKKNGAPTRAPRARSQALERRSAPGARFSHLFFASSRLRVKSFFPTYQAHQSRGWSAGADHDIKEDSAVRP